MPPDTWFSATPDHPRIEITYRKTGGAVIAVARYSATSEEIEVPLEKWVFFIAAAKGGAFNAVGEGWPDDPWIPEVAGDVPRVEVKSRGDRLGARIRYSEKQSQVLVVPLEQWEVFLRGIRDGKMERMPDRWYSSASIDAYSSASIDARVECGYVSDGAGVFMVIRYSQHPAAMIRVPLQVWQTFVSGALAGAFDEVLSEPPNVWISEKNDSPAGGRPAGGPRGKIEVSSRGGTKGGVAIRYSPTPSQLVSIGRDAWVEFLNSIILGTLSLPPVL